MTEALGPAGVQRRMQEIQAKMDAAFGTHRSSFAGTLDEVMKNSAPAISGEIGNGNAPVNPMAGNLQLKLTGDAAKYRSMANTAADQAGVPRDLFAAIIDTESSWDPTSVSEFHAAGLAQLMPSTAKQLGVTNIFDPQQNLGGGARYLAQLLQQFNGNRELAVAAYNAGPGAVTRAHGIPPYPETQNYVRKVLGKVSAYSSTP